jgi:Ribonuclease G/E
LRVSLSPKVADYVQNEKRADLLQLESQHNVSIEVLAVPGAGADSVEICAMGKDGNRLKT